VAQSIQDTDERQVLTHDFGDVFLVGVRVLGGLEDPLHLLLQLGHGGVHTHVETRAEVGYDVVDVLILLVLHAMHCELPVNEDLGLLLEVEQMFALCALELGFVVLDFVLLPEQLLLD